MSEVSLSIQTLLLDDALFPELRDGNMKATIRIGERKMVLDRAMILAARGSFLPVMVNITGVEVTTFGAITDEQAVAAGSTDAVLARRLLKIFYPDIADTTPVTVISFEKA